jgi:hypothetical protein
MNRFVEKHKFKLQPMDEDKNKQGEESVTEKENKKSALECR